MRKDLLQLVERIAPNSREAKILRESCFDMSARKIPLREVALSKTYREQHPQWVTNAPGTGTGAFDRVIRPSSAFSPRKPTEKWDTRFPSTAKLSAKWDDRFAMAYGIDLVDTDKKRPQSATSVAGCQRAWRPRSAALPPGHHSLPRPTSPEPNSRSRSAKLLPRVLDADEESRALRIFDAIDADHSGTIELHELMGHLLMQGQEMEEIALLFQEMDKDGSGKIDMQEWLDGFKVYSGGVR